MDFAALVKKVLAGFMGLARPRAVVQEPMPQVPRRCYMVQQFDWGCSRWRYQHYLGEFESIQLAWHSAARIGKNVRVVEVQHM